MTFWIIEPRDPLIVRDGRPFGPNPGARATTLPFPFPSTVVGAFRHKAGLDQHHQFDRNQIDTILQQGMRGPLLVQLNDNDSVIDWLLPVPADTLLLDPEKMQGETSAQPEATSEYKAFRYWLTPSNKPTITNMPNNLLPVEPSERRPEKVSAAAPRFWHRDVFYNWLMSPANDEVQLSALGIRGLEINTRMHVSIQPEQQTAVEGALFQTSALEFTWRDWEQAKHNTFDTKRLALAAWFDADTPHFSGGFAPLGGERRLMRWNKLAQDVQPFDDQQRNAIFAQIEEDGCCRVVLLTPAYFTCGYRPPLDWTRGGVKATLVAAAVPRMQTISGWDLDADNGNDANGKPRPRGKPKPTRRLAPAGSVYFVKFADDVNVREWLNATWMCNVSDDSQSCLDGFGLAVLGIWNDQAVTMEVK